MERDFLGLSGKESGEPVKDESRGARQDSAFLGGSAAHWPFSNKVSALQQQFMSFKTVQDEKPKRSMFESIPSAGFQPTTIKTSFETNYRASSVKSSPQRCLSFDRQGAPQFSMHAYQPQNTDNFGSYSHQVVSHPSIPVTMSSPFFKIHGSSSVPNLPVTSWKQPPSGGFAANSPTVSPTTGAVGPRNVSRSITSSQLTIFYAGSVNVYNDVPLEKAQAIMLLASKACPATSNAGNQRAETPISAPIPKVAGVDVNANQSLMQAKTLNPSHVSSPMSVSSHAGVQSRSSCCTADTMVGTGTKNIGALPPALSQQEPGSGNTPSTILTRAVPQARKASLARFLEKRKERVSNAIPYSSTKKSTENSISLDGANISGKGSSAELSLSSPREESWCTIQYKTALDGRDSPSTKLTI